MMLRWTDVSSDQRKYKFKEHHSPKYQFISIILKLLPDLFKTAKDECLSQGLGMV